MSDNTNSTPDSSDASTPDPSTFYPEPNEVFVDNSGYNSPEAKAPDYSSEYPQPWKQAETPSESSQNYDTSGYDTSQTSEVNKAQQQSQHQPGYDQQPYGNNAPYPTTGYSQNPYNQSSQTPYYSGGYPQQAYSHAQIEGQQAAQHSMIFGIISIFVLGVILGPIAIVKASKAEKLGVQATAGKVTGWIGAAFGLIQFLYIALIFLFAIGSSASY